jgi:hypothetical protein
MQCGSNALNRELAPSAGRPARTDTAARDYLEEISASGNTLKSARAILPHFDRT